MNPGAEVNFRTADSGDGSANRARRANQAQEAMWARSDKFSMRYGVAAVLIGWFSTFFL